MVIKVNFKHSIIIFSIPFFIVLSLFYSNDIVTNSNKRTLLVLYYVKRRFYLWQTKSSSCFFCTIYFAHYLYSLCTNEWDTLVNPLIALPFVAIVPQYTLSTVTSRSINCLIVNFFMLDYPFLFNGLFSALL